MFKKYLCIVAAFLPFLGFAQENVSTLRQVQGNASTLLPEALVGTSMADTGIKWVKNLSWQQIREKAKKENKYIFVDCYATWCGPCKQMDKETFSKKDVGEFFNDKFIAVKIQMDSTKNDPESVKAWYKDASRFGREYFVFAYPTQLFFNPQGKLVEKITGFQEKDKFISIARASLKPGKKKYEDPYKEFLTLKNKYQKGIKEYQRFPFMISIANETGHTGFAKDLVIDFHQHLLTLSDKELLNRNYIEFINKYGSVSNKNSTNNLSRIFYRDGKKVDALMERKNYSMHALNGMILRGYIKEFLDGVKGEGANASSVPWDSLYRDIAKQFNKEIAEKNTLLAKIQYFDSYNSYEGDPKTISHFIEFAKKYGVEALSLEPLFRNLYVNSLAWKYCVERESDLNDTRYMSLLLEKAIEYAREEAQMGLRCDNLWQFIDTYSALLYKMGEHEKAIKKQMEAIDIYLDCGGGIRDDEHHQVMLEQLGKMQNGGVDFSGSWKLNADKSEFNDTPGSPAAKNLVIEHKNGTITYQRGDHPKESLKIDSTAFIEIDYADSKTKVSIKLTPDKKGLIETRIYTYPEGTTSVLAAKKTRTWTLAADKKTLTIQDHIETTREGLTYDMSLVYERQ